LRGKRPHRRRAAVPHKFEVGCLADPFENIDLLDAFPHQLGRGPADRWCRIAVFQFIGNDGVHALACHPVSHLRKAAEQTSHAPTLNPFVAATQDTTAAALDILGFSAAAPPWAIDLATVPKNDRRRFVESVTNGRNNMPPWGDVLNPGRCADRPTAGTAL
jgi:hypothetical protein